MQVEVLVQNALGRRLDAHSVASRELAVIVECHGVVTDGRIGFRLTRIMHSLVQSLLHGLYSHVHGHVEVVRVLLELLSAQVAVLDVAVDLCELDKLLLR